MGRSLKCCFFTLLVMMQNQTVNADSAPNQDKLHLSPAETALSEELDNARGREGVDMFTLNNTNVRASLNNNAANNNINGLNIIDHGSFAQASGITSVIQNSGNNVIIQNATTMTVTIQP